jgi:hypothetical protein
MPDLMENIWRLPGGKAVEHYTVGGFMYDIRAWHERHQDCDALHVVLEVSKMDGVVFSLIHHVLLSFGHHKLFNIHVPFRFAFAIIEQE